jgi:hypothetical protein
MQVRVLRLGLLQDGGYPDPQLLPRDHASHSASKERPSNTEANPLLLNKSLMRCFWIGHLQSAFCPSRMHINTNKRPETGTSI